MRNKKVPDTNGTAACTETTYDESHRRAPLVSAHIAGTGTRGMFFENSRVRWCEIANLAIETVGGLYS
jgi:hypothetical protein